MTVYDRMPEAGGMLSYSIPAYRLPKAIVRAQVRALEGMGIRFELGAGVGSDGLTLEDLRERYQSVFLATGLWNGKKLRLEKGELLDSGLEFLINVQQGDAKPVGKRVLVIGGGSVAVDVASTARRLGAHQVTMACLESLETMPAIPEDRIRRTRKGSPSCRRGVRSVSWSTMGNSLGWNWCAAPQSSTRKDASRRSFDTEERTIIEVDQVLVAIGQICGLILCGSALQTERGMIAAEKMTTATSLDGIFAGGDVTGRSATVVHAMASGKEAAASIDAYLDGQKLPPSPSTHRDRNC